MEVKPSGKPVMTPDENDIIKSYTGVTGKGFRGLKDETTKPFGVRYAYDETGAIEEQYLSLIHI